MLKKTLQYFKELSKIPRCSMNEQNVIKWLSKWAEDNNFSYKIDTIGNILITVPATVGKENSETIVLQGHVDMVCVKSKESNHDFLSDEIKLLETEGFLRADNTTLGADNGIGVALAMACATLKTHPKLELLFTVDEEKGMSGVLNLEDNFISGTKLLNIDTEVEGEIIIGSAGGARIRIEGDFSKSISKKNIFQFNFSGLKGGHSGLEIDKSKGNIVDSLFQFLDFLGVKFELSSINSGIAENVIAKELEAVISLENTNNLDEKVKDFIAVFSEKYEEFNFDIKFEKIETKVKTIGYDFSNNIKDAILNSRSGVYKMSDDLEGFVLSSQNLGIIRLNEGKLLIEYLCRSSLNEDLDNLIKQNKTVFGDSCSVKIKDMYPGWAEDINSDLIKIVKENYEKVIGNEVKILGIHAGLECGVIIGKMPKNSKAISIGPNIFGAHTINEKCEIRSIGVLSKVLENILKNI